MNEQDAPCLVGHHQDHASAIEDGTLVDYVDFDWRSVDGLEAISELQKSEAEKLAEALHYVLIWVVDRSLMDAKENRTKNVKASVDKALKTSGIKIMVLTMCLAPELIGIGKMREVARLAGVDESYIRRLAGQIRKRWGVQHPFARSKSASTTD